MDPLLMEKGMIRFAKKPETTDKIVDSNSMLWNWSLIQFLHPVGV